MCRHFSLVAALLIAQVLVAQEPKLDAYGDPLPAGAIARLGTLRLRHSGSIANLAFQDGGRVLVTLGRDGALSHWDVATGKELRRFVLFPDAVGDALSDGVSATGMNWGMGSSSHGLPSVALSANGKVLASISDGVEFVLWDAEAGKELRRIKQPEHGTGILLLSADGSRLATEDQFTNVTTWDTRSGKQLAKRGASPIKEKNGPGHPVYIKNLQFSPDGKILARVGSEPTKGDFEKKQPQAKVFVRFIDAETGAAQGSTDAVDFGPGWNSEAAFSPDGKVFAWRIDKAVHLVDVSTYKELRRIDASLSDNAVALAFSPDGKSLLTRDVIDQVLRIWDVSTCKLVRTFGEPVRTTQFWRRAGIDTWQFAISPDGKVAALADEHSVRLLDLAAGKEMPANGHTAAISLVRYAPDGKTLTSWSTDGTFRTWDAATGKEVKATRAVRIREHYAVSPNGSTLAFPIDPQTMRFQDADDRPMTEPLGSTIPLEENLFGKHLFEVHGPQSPFGPYAFSPDGRTFAILGWGEKVLALSLIDMRARKTRLSIPIVVPLPADGCARMPAHDLTGIAFSPDGSKVTAPTNWHTLGIWDAATGREYPPIQAAKDRPIQGVAFSPNGQCAALDLANGLVSIQELATGQERLSLQLSTKSKAQVLGEPIPLKQFGSDSPAVLYSSRPAPGLAYSPNGRVLAHSGTKGTIHLWDLVQRKELAKLTGHRGYVPALAFSPDGKSLASGSRDTTVLLWDVSSFAAKAKSEAKAVDVAACWPDLLSPDAAKAFDSMCKLAAAPGKSLHFLKDNTRPVVTPNAAAIQRLIADLDSEEFTLRKKANQELTKLGEAAIPLIRTALQGAVSPEARKRLEALLAKEPWRLPTGETLRSLRAIEVLELIGTPEAKTVLEGLAKGAPGATVTQAAKESLQRMKR
jgi:WD40 repeat protein